MRRLLGPLVVSLLVLIATARPAQARARRPGASKVSAREVKRRLQKLRKTLLASRGKAFVMDRLLKAQGVQDPGGGVLCEGSARSVRVSEISAQLPGRTAWALMVVYDTKQDSDALRATCWIEASRVKGRLQWATFFRPASALKMTVGKLGWERRGRCLIGRVDSSFTQPSSSGDIGSTRKRFYYSHVPKQTRVWAEELLLHHSEGTVPIIEKRQRGAVKWLRVGKSYYLIHSVTTTRHGGDHGEKVTSKKLGRAVYQLDAGCALRELKAAQVKALRKKRGGKKIPLPIEMD